ncbi:TIGR02300 family protein [Bartonella tamiae]|uniref:TIGR02300 family protein n=1 Tax=Bartonella tamiae Th239 TaxID=1094558 RepID=J0R679_9HYPH|nr:TIGR02300 family protein [Bartonella tamiae]EJF91214.1 TIGR02300 family protein [Bartonella tamiae Th239]EJF93121.1 TIGR02300 family protein [Bartonella tamiae Th307]
MAKPELGTKRIDPETGKKFYDLNRDPVISPYTGISYPRSYFEASAEAKGEEEEVEAEELDTALEKPEFISLEDADDETKGNDDLPDLGDDDIDLGDDGDDAFLPDDDDDENDDVNDILGGGISNDDE